MPTIDGSRRSPSRPWRAGRQGDHEAAADLVEQVRDSRATRSPIGRRHPALPAGPGGRWPPSATAGATPRPGCASREAFFAAGGYERAARRCRTLIGEAGAPVPRRRPRAPRSCRRRCAPSASPAGRSTCSSSSSTAARPGRSPIGCTCRPRPSSGTWPTCSTAPACGTGRRWPRSAGQHGLGAG